MPAALCPAALCRELSGIAVNMSSVDRLLQPREPPLQLWSLVLHGAALNAPLPPRLFRVGCLATTLLVSPCRSAATCCSCASVAGAGGCDFFPSVWVGAAGQLSRLRIPAQQTMASHLSSLAGAMVARAGPFPFGCAGPAAAAAALQPAEHQLGRELAGDARPFKPC